MVDIDRLKQPWAWLLIQLSKVEVLQSLLLLALTALLIVVILFKFVPYLLNHHLDEVSNRLFDQYQASFRAKGIRNRSLQLIARCLVWVFGLKLSAELLEPFVALALPTSKATHFSVSQYDWLVLVALIVLVLTFWIRFMLDVRDYDRSKAEVAIRSRPLSRANVLFWRPALAVLVLLFLPDLGKKATSIAADVVKENGLPFVSSARAGE